MQITTEPLGGFTILHLRGEFDTTHCPQLQEEIDGLLAGGASRVALNLRHVRFINSTALGVIIQVSKELSARDGKLVVSRPSVFCKDVMGRVGLERAVPIYDTDEEAARALLGDAEEPLQGDIEDELEDESTLLFAPLDPERVKHFIPEHRRVGQANPVHRHRFGSLWRGVGRMTALDGQGLRFLWNGGATRLTPFEMGQMFAIGTDVVVKFRLPLLRRGFCQAVVTIRGVEERPDGVELTATFDEIGPEEHRHVRQYATDIAFLKEELRREDLPER